MITYHKFQLPNGLRVIVHEEPENPMATLNVLYDVGARDENEAKTGFAHLFEHLMFEGSINVADYDEGVHLAGGQCNAFTSSDMTNYYITLPAHNIESAFWLESDRMLSLAFDPEALAVQKGVVVEEFKETQLNQPYGDAFAHLKAMSYRVHPYKWEVIGKEISHIENAQLDDVRSFFFRHYRPNRAILSVAGGVKTDQIKQLAEKWFGSIEPGETYNRQLPQEPPQTEFRAKTIEADVPVDAIYLAFHCCARTDADYHATELLAEILSGGSSGRLFRRLVKENTLFSSLNAYCYGHFDNDLFYIEGKLSHGITFEQAETAIWQQLDELKTELVSGIELQKVVNKVESSIVFAETSLWEKAFMLAFYELLGNIDDVNDELSKYEAVTAADLQRIAQAIFTKQNCSAVYYQSRQAQPDAA